MCLCVPDFSSRSNHTDFELVSKCSQHLPLHLNRARFKKILFVYFFWKFFLETLEKWGLIFRIFFLSESMKSKIKNRTLLSCSGKCWLHFDTNPKSLSLDLEEKSGTHEQVKTEKITLRKTHNKFDLKNHFFFFIMRYRKKLRIVR